MNRYIVDGTWVYPLYTEDTQSYNNFANATQYGDDNEAYQFQNGSYNIQPSINPGMGT